MEDQQCGSVVENNLIYVSPSVEYLALKIMIKLKYFYKTFCLSLHKVCIPHKFQAHLFRSCTPVLHKLSEIYLSLTPFEGVLFKLSTPFSTYTHNSQSLEGETHITLYIFIAFYSLCLSFLSGVSSPIEPAPTCVTNKQFNVNF